MKLSDRIRMYLRRNGLIGNFRRLADDPRKFTTLFDEGEPHFYGRECEVSRDEIIKFVKMLTDEDDDRIRDLHEEIMNDVNFCREIESAFSNTVERPDRLHRNWRDVLYILTRIIQPDMSVETGVYDGLSSAYILRALHQNGTGRLISIDINEREILPTDVRGVKAGWVVPNKLRGRWNLIFGDSKTILPDIVKHNNIELFLHDSLHTYDHMMAEFNAVREGMGVGDIFLSDNIEFNAAFKEFASIHLKHVVTIKNTHGKMKRNDEYIDDKFGGGVISD